MNLLRLDAEVVLPLYKRMPLEIEKGEGNYLIDVNGKKYLDFASGIAVNALGYQHPAVIEAVRDQMSRFMHVSNYITSKPVVELSKLLVAHSFASKVFFANSGTEANEAMLKLAKKFGQGIHKNKTKLIALHGGFHGRTLGSMSLTGNTTYKSQFEPLMPGVVHVPINDIQALEKAMDESVCGIFIELVQGEAGVHLLTQAFAKAVEKAARENQALILLDEVQTGLMRTGKLFAYEHYDLTPDAMTLAKALGGGLPLGAMLVSQKLESVLEAGEHGSTFGGNPVSAAAGLAVIKELLNEKNQNHVVSIANYLKKELTARQKKYPDKIKSVRGMGLMLGIELFENAQIFKEMALANGLITNTTAKNVVRLLPPLTINTHEVNQFLKVLDIYLS